VHPLAVASKLPVLNADPATTMDQIAYTTADCAADPSTFRWCNCTWDSAGVGLDATKAASATYYNGLVELYAEWGVDLIKWDCMYDDGSADATYAREEVLASNAVKAVQRPMILSLSPGGGMLPAAAAWAAGVSASGGGHGPPAGTTPGAAPGPQASMYRITGDFHSRPLGWIDGLGEHVFTLGNLSSTARGAGRGLIGVNNTWPDSDIIDLGRDSAFYNTPAAELHASIWMMARSPLMYGGNLPIQDNYTLNLISNQLALMVNEHSDDLRVSYAGDCRCTLKGKQHGHACKPINDPSSSDGPCVATWWSDISTKGCKAVAFLNIGIKVATPDVMFTTIGLSPGSSYTVTNVFEKTSQTVKGASFGASVQGTGGVMFVVAPAGVAANECVSA